MTIEVPAPAFSSQCSPLEDELILTPDLQRWARATAHDLAEAGRRVPPDLSALEQDKTLCRHRWVWLLDEALRPLDNGCPF